jgi:NADPH:quinone reductase-like Zn-dependent oxidoreductase
LKVAKKLGATHLINYKKTPNWDEEVKRLTEGKGVDHVVDVAGSGTLPKSLRSARFGGLVSIAGLLSGSHDLGDLVPELIFQAKSSKCPPHYNRFRWQKYSALTSCSSRRFRIRKQAHVRRAGQDIQGA